MMMLHVIGDWQVTCTYFNQWLVMWQKKAPPMEVMGVGWTPLGRVSVLLYCDRLLESEARKYFLERRLNYCDKPFLRDFERRADDGIETIDMWCCENSFEC